MMVLELGDVDPVSAAIGALGVIVAVALGLVLHRLTGYRVKARLSVAVRLGTNNLIHDVSAVDVEALNPHVGKVEQVVAVRIINSGRSPVTVSSLQIQNVRRIRQKLLQKLRLLPGFVIPWVPTGSMTEVQLPVRLTEHDQQHLVFPLAPVEVAAAVWARLLETERAQARAVLTLGNDKKIYTNKVWLPLVRQRRSDDVLHGDHDLDHLDDRRLGTNPSA